MPNTDDQLDFADFLDDDAMKALMLVFMPVFRQKDGGTSGCRNPMKNKRIVNMHNHGQHRSSMDQQIFNLGLTVEETSLYLLCCGLADAGKPITKAHLAEVWNGDENMLLKGLENLEKRHILARILSDRQNKHVYRLTDAKSWKTR